MGAAPTLMTLAEDGRLLVGTGEPIPAMDIADAIALLAQAEAADSEHDAVDGKLRRDAVRLLAEHHGLELCSGDCDEEYGCDSGDALLPDWSDISWALSRARGGDIADAMIHLRRAFADVPEITETLDLIGKRLP